MATDLELAFVTGAMTGMLFASPDGHKLVRLESNAIAARASAIARAERTQRLLDAARERLGRR